MLTVAFWTTTKRKIKDPLSAVILHSLGHERAHRCHAECIGDDRVRWIRRCGVIVHFHFNRLIRTQLGFGGKTFDGRRILGFDIVDHELVSIVEFTGFNHRRERREHRQAIVRHGQGRRR